MRKTGILTFHAAHNYGSMLQAYALKNYIENHGALCEIINYRTATQKDIYAVLTKRKGIKYTLKNAYALLTYRAQKEKWQRFEDFLKEELACEKELSVKDINSNGYDAVITGSDQIWNINANDFSDIYLGKSISFEKIAYAASCGTRREDPANGAGQITELLSEYSHISVRDSATKDFVHRYLPEKPVDVVCDPVVLHDKTFWDKIISAPRKRVPQKYIFMYTLQCSKDLVSAAKKVSYVLGLPIVISKVTNQYDMVMKAKKVLGCGPKEFLYLLKNAEVVVTSSFHAMLFSLIYDKKIFLFDGQNDNRHKDIIEKFALQQNILSAKMSNDEIVSSLQNMQTDYSEKIPEYSAGGRKFIGDYIL